VQEVRQGHVAENGRVEADRVERAMVHGDHAELARAVENLVENALVHGPPGGRVTIELDRRADRALLTVRDEGPGPDLVDRERLFERFWRGDEAAGRPGSGLGLSIVSAIVARHGGAVRVDGSAFTLDLPALEEQDTGRAPRLA
jgi:signal transduction histidine kinase